MKNETVFQRYEFKYLLTRDQQARLLAAAGEDLRPDVYSHSSIRNLYLDTPDFRLIRRSLEKPVYKEKLRLRSYGRTDRDSPVFMELKKKYRSIVYKRRLTLPYDRALDCLTGACPWPETQIGGEIRYTGVFDPVLEQYAARSELKQVKTTNMGSLFKLTYDLTLRDGGQEKALIDALRQRNGNLEISLCQQETGAAGL